MNKFWRIALVIFIISMLCVSFLPLATPVYAGATYYVAKTGNDGNDGSVGSPWLTIQHAADTMVAGDTVFVKAGTYNEKVSITTSGSAGNFITYEVYSGDTVIIDGSGIACYPGLVNIGHYTTNTSYIKFIGFQITDADDYSGVTVEKANTSYIYLEDLTISDTYKSGIIATYSLDGGAKPNPTIHNIYVDNCEISNSNISGLDEAISFMGVENFEIENCIVHDTPIIDGYPYGKEGICLKGNSQLGTVHGNTIYNTKMGVYYGSSADGDTTTIDVYNNLIYSNRMAGIYIASEDGNGSCLDSDIYNNILYDNFRGFVVASYAGTGFTTSFNFINNTLWHEDVDEVYLDNTNTTIQNSIIRNNIIVANSFYSYLIYAASTTGLTIDHNLFYNSYGYGGQTNRLGTSYVQANPLLVNPSSDFSIPINSPAKDVGSATGAPSTDYEGTSRPLGAEYDIGAYEYNSLSAPTNVSATDGTATDKVVVTWTKSDFATGYKVYRNGTLVATLGDVATYDDTGASAPTITVGTSSASDGSSTSYTTLGVSGESSNNGTSYSYTVKATNADGDSATSSANTGYRGSGLLLYQWQRKVSGGSYSDLAGATTDAYNDTSGTAGTTYYYRCKLSA